MVKCTHQGIVKDLKVKAEQQRDGSGEGFTGWSASARRQWRTGVERDV
jgi:hypothetical protein